MDLQRRYYLLLGDLKQSTRTVEGQAPVAIRKLVETVSELSGTFADELVLDMEVNYGDEFAGLFHRPAALYDVIDRLRHELRGIAGFRVAIAYGRIGHAASTMTQMGGPAFQMANDALIDLKKSDAFARWQIGGELENLTLTALTNAADSFRQNMTDYQYEVFRYLSEGLSQTETARALGKFDQSVSTAAKRGHTDVALALDKTIRQRLAALQTGEADHAGSNA